MPGYENRHKTKLICRTAAQQNTPENTDAAEHQFKKVKIKKGKSSNTGSANTGKYNKGNLNSGSRNTGSYNTGDGNIGNNNSGNTNIGDRNTGDFNRGSNNSGDRNIGDNNTGDWNMTNFSCGCFNTDQDVIFMFNKISNWTRQEWLTSRAHEILFNMPIDVYKIPYTHLNSEQKTRHPESQITGYCHKKVDNSRARQMKWDSLNQKDKDAVMSLPNFDPEIFRQITGISVDTKNG